MAACSYTHHIATFKYYIYLSCCRFVFFGKLSIILYLKIVKSCLLFFFYTVRSMWPVPLTVCSGSVYFCALMNIHIFTYVCMYIRINKLTGGRDRSVSKKVSLLICMSECVYGFDIFKIDHCIICLNELNYNQLIDIKNAW